MELKHFKSESIPEEWKECYALAQKKASFNIKNNKDERENIMIKVIEEGEFVSFLKGTIYEKGTLGRCAQYSYGGNKDRVLWIDFMWSSKKGNGRKMIECFESYVRTLKIDGKKNIYVFSLDSSFMFYIKCGYSAISTPNHPEDREFPSIAWEDGKWLAKALYVEDTLDNEKIDYNREILTWVDVDYLRIVGDYEAIEKKIDVLEYLRVHDKYVQEYVNGIIDCLDCFYDDKQIANPFSFDIDSSILGWFFICLIEKYILKSKIDTNRIQCDLCNIYKPRVSTVWYCKKEHWKRACKTCVTNAKCDCCN